MSARKTLKLLTAELVLETRCKNGITASLSRKPPTAGAYEDQKARESEFPNAKRKYVGPCNTYNCHGLTFGSRRAALEWSEIPDIIKEDDYQEVHRNRVKAGDLAIYYAPDNPLKGITGHIEHSGIVLERTTLGSIRVWSKWGFGDEWVHFLNDCPYNSTNVKFYRLNDCPRTLEA